MTRVMGPLALSTVVLLSQGDVAAAVWRRTGPSGAAPALQSTVPGRPTPPPPARCGPVDTESVAAPYTFQYGLSPDTLQSQFYGSQAVANDGSYNDEGYRPVRLTGYVDDGQVRYATKWVRDGGPEWQSRFGLTGAQFHARYLTLSGEGFRLLDASGYNTPAGTRYADIWLKNTNGLAWAVTRDVPAAQMNALKLSMLADGMAPTHIEGYLGVDLLPRFIITWVKSPCEWAMEEAMTSVQYQAFFDAHKLTMRPVHVDSYGYDSLVRFAGIFWRQPGPVFRATHGQHWYGFQASLNHDTCDGFSLDNFYGMELPDGWQAFGGIWSYRGTPAVSGASSIDTRVNYHVNCAAGRAVAALINVTTGETVLSHADQWVGTASGSKPWAFYALLRKADAEGIDLDSTEVDGKTLSTLATEMIVDSNNASTNTLIDFVGMSAINDELEALGLSVSRFRRYMTGGPSAHGLASWWDDFKAGYDNFTTARELATFWRLVYENNGLLSADAYGRFLSITISTGTTANNALAAGYDPAFVSFYNKAGSKSYGGSPGDFAHRPQLGAHKIGSEGGVMAFANGNLVFYAAIVDEAAPAATGNTIACIGWEAAKEWGGGDPGDSSGQCVYP